MAFAATLGLASGPLADLCCRSSSSRWYRVISRGVAGSSLMRRADSDMGWAAILVVVVTTSGLAQSEGPPLVSASVTHWLGRWYGPAALRSASCGAPSCMRDASDGARCGWLVVAWHRRLSPCLLAWLAWACLLTLRPGRSAEAWLVMGPPLLLSAARAVGWLHAAFAAATTRLALVPLLVAAAAAGVLAAQAVHASFEVARGRYDSPFHALEGRTGPMVACSLTMWRAAPAEAEGGAAVEVVASDGVDPCWVGICDTSRCVGWPRPRWTATRRVLVGACGRRRGARGHLTVRQGDGLPERVRLR